MTGSEQVPLILIDVMRKCLQHDPKARPTVADLLDIPYLQSNVTTSIVPSIPSNILMKIKKAHFAGLEPKPYDFKCSCLDYYLG